MSFIEWLEKALVQRLENLMAENLSALNAAVAANTAATNAAVAAFASASSEDFTAQVTALDANTAALNALAPASTPPAASPITASPASVSLSLASPEPISVTLAESNAQPNTYQAFIANTAIAVVSPASGAGPFLVELASGAVAGTTSLALTDAQGNVLNVPVVAA